MRVLAIDQYGELGGGQRCLLEAAEGFRARGWMVYGVVPAQGPLAVRLEGVCDKVHRIPCGPFTPTRKSARDVLRFAGQLPGQVAILRRIIREERVDAVYVNGAQVLPAAALARLWRPVVFHVHWVVTQGLAASLGRVAAQWADAFVVASSEFVARSVREYIAPERVRVVYNGVAAPARLERVIRPPRHVAMLGRIAPEKGQLDFVRAAKTLGSSGLRFSVCGAPMFSSSGYMDQVRREAEGLEVEFPGWTDDVAAWLAGVDLLVVPSDVRDNIPRVILEAFAAGVPVIAYGSGGIPELVEDGVSGFLVRERGVVGLADAIRRAVGSPEELRRVGERGWRRARERFALTRFQSEVCDALEDAARVRQSRAPAVRAGSSAEA